MARVLNVYVPENLVERLDTLAEAERKANPGRIVSRNSIVREILSTHLASLQPVAKGVPIYERA